MQKTWIYFLMALLAANLAEAAIIYGTVYDLSLKKVSNARVEIDTSPKQFMIAQNGSYSFNVPYGYYTIRAQLFQRTSLIASTEENITIKHDGNYVLDLILFPDVEEGIEDIGIDIGGDIPDTKNGNVTILITTSIFLILIVLGSFLVVRNRKRMGNLEKGNPSITKNDIETKEELESDDLRQVIEIIRKEGGRATQKDIRKQIPLSEGKISLMIAELEHKGMIEKIKKGRGNIIILKKK